ncbi:CHAT domain-containing tetratricopeptide repeat protein [Stigmatella hybrida]|uniref:CHAT domain-containing tetratricopeptide repeat protein n=1 Tax=Stigmatella hybrida TaxID=394097 RepID=UPI001CDB1E5A|nr:CHAT domain-containing protein [Stigmatella hybrida]
MRHALGWLMTLALCCAVEGWASEKQPDVRLGEAREAVAEASRLKDAGQYPEALVQAERALVLREAVLGDAHPEVADCLYLAGSIHWRKGDLSRAEPSYMRALAIQEKALGKNHLSVASSLRGLATIYEAQGLYSRAEPLYQRALAIREKSLGPDDPGVADALEDLASLYLVQGLYGRVEPLYQRALAIRERALGPVHPDVAYSLSNLANLYADQGLYGQAETLYQRALKILEEALGPSHPDVASAINNLANLYHQQGLYGKAEPLHRKALESREAVLGPNHPDVASSLNNLAGLYQEQGLYGRAEPLYQRALDIRKKLLGESHPGIARLLGNLATLYMLRGMHGQAEPLYQRAIVIIEMALSPRHPDLADSLNSLANLYVEQGLYSRAEALYLRSIALVEAALGKRHISVATSLNSLANLYADQHMYDRAKPLYLRALSIREAALGPNHPNVASALSGLANLYADKGLYKRARVLHQRALGIRKDALGPDHPDIAASLDSLADLYKVQGLYRQAESLYRSALAIVKKSLGESHPLFASLINDLGQIYSAQGHLAEALPLFTQAFSSSELRLRQEALDFSESRLSSFLQYLRADEQRLYSLLSAHPEDEGVRHLALSAVLLLKGRSVAETANISRTLYRRLGPEDLDTLERLRGLRTQLAILSFEGPGPLRAEIYQQRLRSLEEEGDSLEAELAKRSAPLRALSALPPPAEIVGRVAASLSKESALVEFITYQDTPLLPKPGTPPAKAPGPMRYMALVLSPDASIRTVDLGPTAPIDRAASRLRDALAEKEASFQPIAEELYRRAFQPLVPLLGQACRLFLSPDGQLGLVPFSALHDGQGFLLDAFEFSHLTSGRELLSRAQDSTPPPSHVFVLADPDFTASAEAMLQGSTPYSNTLERFFAAPPQELSRNSWVPLPGARLEAESIQRLLPQAKLFLGAKATKQRLLYLPTPGILHLATHGFFLGDAPAPANFRGLALVDALGSPPPPQKEPLLNSGLVLAGAHVARSGPGSLGLEASLVTALELAGLDLWGTQLVVLSGCDTGRGEVHLGQGVYGLRRALVAAGAETVVVSLWKVNDDSTRLLMERYYRHLLAGKGRVTALREAMRELRLTHPHPHSWAPFIALGNDAPLHGMAGIP